ncbi:hypothetical protein [Cobetia sp. 5-25-4-2]|uniref:hypothetical protein n=1 Tax=Cobetia sp. 5-25-4-2 TaxID=2737459 RepID=UPI001596DDC1|nr:hypothetical protein [Cobetia sp. 5-25-4-2]
MISKDRAASFYSMKFKAAVTSHTKAGETHPKVPAPFIKKAITIIEKAAHKDYKLTKNSEVFIIKDICIKPKYILMLVSFTSDSYSDPAYLDTSNNNRNEIKKKISEKMEFSCHIMIAKKMDNDSCNMLVEKVPGFTKAKIKLFINSILRNYKQNKANRSEFEFNHPDGSLTKNNKPRKCRISLSVDINGCPSDRLINDLENGTIKGLKLTHSTKETPWDSDGYFEEKNSSVSFRVSAPSGSRVQAIRNFVSQTLPKRGDFNSARIQFTPPGQTTGTESASLDIDAQDPFSCEYFNKTISLNYSAQHTSYSGFISEIIESMEKHLRVV